MAAALGLALALDLPTLRAGLWNDELTTLEFARGSFADLVRLAGADPTPPLYYFAVWLLFRVVPPGGLALRLVSLAAHLVLVAVVHAYARRWHGARVATVAAIAVAANPAMAWYGTNGRVYALSCVAGMLCVAAYRAEAWLAFGAACALAPWLHYGSALCPALLVAWDLAVRRRLAALKPALVAAVACLPLPFHFVHATLMNHPPFARFELAAWIQQLRWWAGLDALPGAWLLFALWGLATVLAVQARACALEAALWLGSSGALAAIAAWHGSSYHPKFILWTLPLAQIALARALPERVAPWWLAVVVAGGILASGAEKSVDRAMARALAKQVSPRDRLVLDDRTRGAFRYYFLERTRGGAGEPSTWFIEDGHGDEDRIAVRRVRGVERSVIGTATGWNHVTFIEPAP